MPSHPLKTYSFPFLHSFCAECLKFDKGPFEKNCSLACANVTLQSTPIDITPCKERDSEGCWLTYTLQQKDGWNIYGIHVEDIRGEAGWCLGHDDVVWCRWGQGDHDSGLPLGP